MLPEQDKIHREWTQQLPLHCELTLISCPHVQVLTHVRPTPIRILCITEISRCNKRNLMLDFAELPNRICIYILSCFP